MKPAMTQADMKAVNAAVDATEKAVNERHGKPEATPDAFGPRIPVRLLHFLHAVNLPGGRFEQYLERMDNPKQRQYLIDYLPKMQLYEVKFVPAPGDRAEVDVEFYPREFASFRPCR